MEFIPNSEHDVFLGECKVHLYYFDYSEEKPYAIILHGLRADTERIKPFVNILKSMYNVVTVDLPGFGKSAECVDFKNYIHLCSAVLDKLIRHLGVPTEKLGLFGISHGANVIVDYLLMHPLLEFQKIGLMAPIYSRKYLSMKPAMKRFVYWFTKTMAKGGYLCWLIQKLVDSDRLFPFFVRLVDKESAQSKSIVEYEKKQWRLMTMQHWGRTLGDFLKIDLSTLNITYQVKNIVFAYPQHDQYLDVESSISGFKKLFPNADFRQFASDKHIPRGDVEENETFMSSIREIIDQIMK